MPHTIWAPRRPGDRVPPGSAYARSRVRDGYRPLRPPGADDCLNLEFACDNLPAPCPLDCSEIPPEPNCMAGLCSQEKQYMRCPKGEHRPGVQSASKLAGQSGDELTPFHASEVLIHQHGGTSSKSF